MPTQVQVSKYNSGFTLQIVNQTSIKTYGQHLLKHNRGLRRSFSHMFIVTDIPHPILGADFLERFNLSVNIRRQRLTDDTTRLSVIGNTIHCLFECLSHIPSVSSCRYTELLRKFPDLTDLIRTRQSTTHDIMHHIKTTAEQPSSGRRVRFPDRSVTYYRQNAWVEK